MNEFRNSFSEEFIFAVELRLKVLVLQFSFNDLELTC